MDENGSVLATIANAILILLLGVVYVAVLSAGTALKYATNLLVRLVRTVIRVVRRLFARKRTPESQ